jgi:hypothetical protein
MNNDLTIDTLAFKLAYSDKTGSKRIEVSRGATLPTTMSIAHQIVKDSKSGLPARRSVLRFDRTQILDGSGTLMGDVTAYVVVQAPQGVAVVGSDIVATVQHLISTLQEDDSGLDLMDEIFVNQEQ